MMHRHWLVLLSAVLMLPAAVELRTVSAQETGLRVVDQRELGPGLGGPVLRLSPDGRSLATLDENHDLCIHDVAFLSVISCVSLERHGINGFDRETLVWSPDSIHIAFTDDYKIQYLEPDVWVLDAATGELVNLTDDGVNEIGQDGDPYNIDLTPAWSPDGQELAFFRTAVDQTGQDGDTNSELGGTALYKVNAAGGEPIKITGVASTPVSVQYGAHWSVDGSTLHFSLLPPGGEADLLGIWETDLESGDTQKVLGNGSGDFQRPLLVDMSPRNQALIVTAPAAQSDIRALFALVDLASGRTAPLGADGEEVWHAVFSPAGTHVLFLGENLDQGGCFVSLLETTSGRSQRLLSNLDSPCRSRLPTEGITWSSANSIYLPPFPDLLIWLSTE